MERFLRGQRLFKIHISDYIISPLKYALNSTMQFIHSGYFISAYSSPLLLRGAPDYNIDTVLEFPSEAPQASASEELAQGPYVAARAGFEPTTLQTKGVIFQ